MSAFYAEPGDTLDLFCHRHLGQTAGVMEATLQLNPHLHAYPVVLPGRVLIQLPVVQPATQSTRNLWD